MRGRSYILELILLSFSFIIMSRPVENDSYDSASRDCNFEKVFIEVKRLVMPNSTLLPSLPPDISAIAPFLLQNQTFADLKSEATLHEFHAHLTLKYRLIDRVIRARFIHHSRLFSLNLDYGISIREWWRVSETFSNCLSRLGHQHYLDNLSNRKFIVKKALQQLERRKAEVLYKRQKWFKWIREKQDEKGSQRESEKKNVKQEAALPKR